MEERKTRTSFCICGCMRNSESCRGYIRHCFRGFCVAELQDPSDAPMGVQRQI